MRLDGLEPGTRYAVLVEARDAAGPETASTGPSSTLQGGFTTPPTAETVAPVRLAVVTCQSIRSTESPTKGHFTYKLLDQLRPDLFVHTGDIVYYDKDPFCRDVKTARCKWNRMYAYPWERRFHLNTTSYFMKDDHDTVKNDCWKGQRYGDLTWEQGLALFREQVPMGEKTYRTVRWGRDLQIWMTENRDFRSPTPTRTAGEDHPRRGAETMAPAHDGRLGRDVQILISPGCLVGPDKKGKKDNHSNATFAHEGKWFREFLAKRKNTIVINGDRTGNIIPSIRRRA